MDRCALFVDAGYVLADGAAAVHGTRLGESVSWDYEGLLQLLSGLARERSGLPVLRCYWYEATIDGRRTAEQDALADLPGIKLRIAKIRPGRREGVEAEIQRDLTALARNNAISDALVVSAEEDLAQVIADVQDLGMRVTVVHIAVDGNWTISRALRQESDDIIEVSGDHLRPYAKLIAGAEPAKPDEEGELVAAGPLANGHLTTSTASYQPMPVPSGNHAPPATYTAPVVAEYQRAAPQLPRATTREGRDVREDRPDRPERQEWQDRPREDRPERQEWQDRPDRQEPASQNRARAPEEASYQPGAPDAGPPASVAPAHEAAPAPPTQLRRLPPARNPANQAQTGPMGVSGAPPMPPAQIDGQGHGGQGHGGQGHGGQGHGGGPAHAGPAHAGPGHGGQGPGGQGPGGPGGPGSQGPGLARSAPYSGPQPVAGPATPPGGLATPPGYQNASGGASLSEAVQAAHEEGQEFGGSVARDAPALWLEAVLARKPRMPSDLEARLLQGSALPIDFLLHDEVRHALRRGFWDALERTRR